MRVLAGLVSRSEYGVDGGGGGVIEAEILKKRFGTMR